MPSETHYLTDKEIEQLNEMIDQDETLENRSQAIRYCVNQQAQRDMASEHRLAGAEPRSQPEDTNE